MAAPATRRGVEWSGCGGCPVFGGSCNFFFFFEMSPQEGLGDRERCN